MNKAGTIIVTIISVIFIGAIIFWDLLQEVEVFGTAILIA